MRPKEPDKVKLFISLFTAERALFSEALRRLEKRFGPLDVLSGPLEFKSTDYYEEEFGQGLARKAVSFEELVCADELAEIKLFTNAIEDEFLSFGKKRRVNIDPGVLSLERLVLASCKNFAHRVYLGSGVFAELTLIYMRSGWKPLEWTYPDYKDERMRQILTRMRMRYAFRMGKRLSNHY